MKTRRRDGSIDIAASLNKVDVEFFDQALANV
jgi:hypothetical protein